ncbi:hypothetical protein [Bartonella sp. DGB2]
MMLSTALAGIFGAFVRQLANHDKSCWQRVCEWLTAVFHLISV